MEKRLKGDGDFGFGVGRGDGVGDGRFAVAVTVTVGVTWVALDGEEIVRARCIGCRRTGWLRGEGS